jgi:hypothetical protein
MKDKVGPDFSDHIPKNAAIANVPNHTMHPRWEAELIEKSRLGGWLQSEPVHIGAQCE